MIKSLQAEAREKLKRRIKKEEIRDFLRQKKFVKAKENFRIYGFRNYRASDQST